MSVSNFFFAMSAPGAFYALKESTLVGKAVLVVLFVLSIIAWSVMITKFRQVRRARLTSEEFLHQLRQEKSFLALFSQRLAIRDCPLYEIYVAGCSAIPGGGSGLTAERDAAMVTQLSALDIARIEATLERTVSEQALHLESQVMLLGTAVAAAPFLGLLGTVWGVMDAFAGIALHGNTTIGTLAPGVSAALITTVTGLIVAIPSMVGYNILTHGIRYLTVLMDNFASEFITTVRRESAGGEL